MNHIRGSGKDPYFPAQPLADFSGSKWALPLAHRLVTTSSPLRFRELQRDIPGISGQELTRLLSRFIEQGLIIRYDNPDAVRRVEYRPSETLRSAAPVFSDLASWARSLADALSVSRHSERV